MKQKLKSLQTFLLSLVILIMGTATAWGQTSLSSSNFYQFYAGSETSYGDLITNASLPTYITTNIAANQNTILSAVPSITTPHDFSALTAASDTKYWRLKAGSSKTITITNVANLKKVHFYGNGSSSTRSITTSVAKVSGSGSVFTVATISGISNSNQTIAEYSTVDFTAQSGYDSSTYYTYTFTFSGDVSLWGIYVEAASTPATQYTVTYTVGDGGTCAKSSDTYTGSALTLPTVTPKTEENNYQKVFNGWYTASSGGTRVGGAGDSYTPGDDIELFAQYDTKYYIKTSVAPEGGGAAATIVASDTPISNGSYVMEGTVITVTAGAANSGYAWNRWSVGTNNASLSFNYTVAAKKTYTANYTTNTAITPSSAAYTVGDTPSSITYAPTLSPAGDGATYQWYKNSANSAVVDNEHKIDGATSATLAAAKIDTGSEGTTYYYCVVTPTYDTGSKSGTSATSNIVTVTVSAAVATTYTVTYNANLAGTTGSVPTDATAYAEGETVIVKGNTGTLAKSGYTFLGWSTTSGYSSTYKVADETITMGTANVTLYAQWKLNSSLVSSSPASGTLATGAPVYTTATSPATGMYAEQAATAFDFTTLKAQTLKELEVGWTNNSSDAGGTQTLSVLLTDGTFYSDVITFPYTVGVATPVISCSSNTVTITCATDGAEIYYTTDGNAPSSSSTAYSASGPFSIDADCTVKAIAIKNATNSAEASRACTHEDISTSTSLPVTYNFGNSTKWPESGNFIGTAGTPVTLTNRAEEDNHNIVFRASATNKFNLTNGTKLTMNDNASTSNFIAIPISGINGRIDIDVWSPYTSADEYTLRYVLDTSKGTTVQSSAPSDITKKKSANGWVTDHFNFRINNISATTTSGVLYIGRGESGFPDFYKIMISTPRAYLVPTPESLTLGDAQTDTVVIKNYTPYNVRIKTYADEAIAKSFYDPVSNKLAIDAVAPGSTNVVLFADINGNGTEDSEEVVTRITIPITINGITAITTPSSAVYDTSGGSPSLADISITATHRSGADMTYQWYKNTVNSNTGGTAISGATNATLSNDKISTSATEDASFYYCVVSSAGCKSKASDVAYVLTSKTKRYFQMSNVAGNKETSTNDEKITGQVIAGGQAYVQTNGDYRYITRPNTNVAHMYVANGSDKYFKITLDNDIAEGDVISVLINGYLSDRATGVKISTDTSGSNAITLNTGSDTSVKTYSATFTAAYDDLRTIYVMGNYDALQNYFTDLIISKPANLVVGAPTPATQTVQKDDTPETISVIASGGTGSYSYQWYSNTSNTATVDDTHKIDDATSASYTPPTTAAGTTYYYCTVTSGGSTVTSTTAKVEVKDIEHGWHNPAFTDNVEVYALTETNFKAQPSSPNHFWTKESSVGYTNVTIAPVSETKTNYMRLKNSSNQKSMTFYVKNAIAFDMVAGDGNNTDRTANIKVGTTKVGTLKHDQKWTSKFALDADGDTITIDGPSSDFILGALRFYMYSPIEVSRAGTVMERDTIYVDDTSVAYDVTSSRPGALSVTKPDGATGTVTDYSTSTARVQFDAEHGVLTVSPIALGTETITIAQAASGDYPAITRTFTVVVAKHTLNLEFSLDEININASILTSGSAIPAGSLPTLHAYKDGVEVTGDAKDALGIKYMSDDVTIGRFADEDNYTITYGGGQGGALIYAYVASSDYASSAKDYFGLNIKAGTSNALPSTAKAGEDKEIYEQKRFELQNDEGENVVTLVYGGYKYDKEGGWTNASSRGKYHIDGFKYYTRHDIDALDEYGYQLRGMSDENLAAPSSLELKKDMDHHDYSHTYHLSSWSSQNVGSHKFWYASGEGGTTGDYQRIRPFTLPCYGGYLKFETHKTGTLTVYVWQNGSINAAETTDSKKLGTKPRLSYWFDQDGWVKQPKVAPITKQPITNSKYGHDTFCNALKTEDALDDKWTEANGDKAIIPMLLRKYCNSAKTVFSNTKESGYIDNPYYWMTSGDIENNLNEERTIIPKKMTPVPYHNGYMVPEESYLKYVIDVVAGKTYYFYGMMTKIGYVGMNFIEDNGVKAAYKVTEVPTLHLNTNDNMETVVNSMGDDYDFAVYNEVTLPSNYRAGKWNTICLPFALSEDQVEEAFGKGTQLTLYNGLIKKGTDYTIKYLSHVDTNILPGQPYFIKPSGVDASGNALPTDENGILGSAVEGQTGTRITFNTVCIDKKKFSTTACKYSNDSDVDVNGVATGKDAGFELVGTYAKTAIDQYSYLINASTGNLRQYTGSTTSAANGLNTYHAFLRPKNADVKHNSLSQIDFEEDAIIEYAWLDNGTSDTPTPVKTIEEEVVDALNSGKMVMPNKAYNLMGQEVDPRSAKGLVIINGKKVMY